MRCVSGSIFALVAGLASGCGAGQPGVAGNCGWQGTGGGAAFVAPGLWAGHVDDAEAGGTRLIQGYFTSGFAEVEARRTTDGGYCELPYSVRVGQLP